MRFSFYRTVTETLGFAIRRYDTVARVGWFPLFLLLLFSLALPFLFLSIINGKAVTLEMIAHGDAVAGIAKNAAVLWQQHGPVLIAFEAINYVVTTLMYASFFVPLLQLAARGTEPSHRSVVLHIGPRHFKFLFATLATLVVMLLLFYAPLYVSLLFIENYVAEAMAAQYASFPDETSLHTIEIVSGMSNLWAWSTLTWVLVTVFGVAFGYFGLRFLPLPFFAAVREKGDAYRSVPAAWRFTRGFVVLKMLLSVVVLALLFIITTLVLNFYVLPMFLDALNAMFMLAMQTDDVMSMLGRGTGWIGELLAWLWTVIRIVANMLWIFFLTGLIAGFGGSVLRQSGELR